MPTPGARRSGLVRWLPSAVTAPGKWLLSFLMILGRLEIFPVLLLFTRHLWRR